MTTRTRSTDWGHRSQASAKPVQARARPRPDDPAVDGVPRRRAATTKGIASADRRDGVDIFTTE